MLLRIADFVIEINQKDASAIKLDEGYQPFVVKVSETEVDLVVNAFGQLPQEQLPTGMLLYRAQMPEGELWKVSKSEETYIFHVFDADEPGVLQQVCTTDSLFREWNVYMAFNTDEASTIDPLKYPLGPLLMYYLTVKHEAIMIHASGISDNGIGRIFTGVSGKGKSTTARIWFEAGADVLNDDRLIIRKEKKGYSLHNTPMFYADRPRSSEFKAAYIIRHEKENVLEKLSGATAVSALAANCIQHGYDRKMVEHHLNFLSEMVNEISVQSLGFVPDKSVVQAVRDHDV
ncbi:MAG: hypothetical protein K9G46_14605 [Flavobacteriales bacterium]|jgi:hypothetical protein|nr:hypothetical protein [Flavobacteriales bacterium]